jgi:hypothetical protein
VIYAITPDGRLLWYRYTPDPSGTAQWDANSSQQIGDGWQDFTWVFSGGGGLIYAVTPDGDLLYYRDVFGNGANAADGSTGWDPNSGAAIGFGWSDFRHVLSGGGGVIYAVTEDGNLLWYGDQLQDGTNGPEATQGWATASGSGDTASIALGVEPSARLDTAAAWLMHAKRVAAFRGAIPRFF